MELWQMTQAEYVASMKGKRIEHVYYNRLGQLISNHRNEVEWAMQLQRPVTDQVLQDYPEIKRRYRRE